MCSCTCYVLQGAGGSEAACQTLCWKELLCLERARGMCCVHCSWDIVACHKQHDIVYFQVLTWLEANCRVAVCRADQNDPLISEQRDRYYHMCVCIKSPIDSTCVCPNLRAAKRYTGVPRNIYRHILISDLDRVVAALPPVNFVWSDVLLVLWVTPLFPAFVLQDLTQTSINMYDPLPPTDSTCGYTRPERLIWHLYTK